MATQNSINQGDSTRIFTGIESWGGSGAYFDDTTLGSFSVLRAGKGYVKGKPVTWAGSQTITGLVAGTTYWICIDVTGTIVKFDTFSTAIFTDNIPLFECLRDSTSPTNNQYTVREDHPYWVEANTSIFLHNVIGPVIRNTNNGANITLSGTQKIQIVGTDYLEDHGLTTTISDSGGAAVTFRKMFTNASGKWCTYTDTDTFTGHYNNAGTVTAISSGYYALYTLYVSKDTITSATPTYYAVMHTAQFNTSTAANTAIANGTNAKATNELYNLELAQLGYVIYRESTSAISTVTISKSTLKQTLSTSGSNVAANITTNVTNFDGILSSADTTAQAAFETIDNYTPTKVGINPQTADYTLVLADAGKLVTMTLTSTANTLTIPKNSSVAFPTGTFILIEQGGTGQTTIAPVDGDVTLRSTDSLDSLYGIYSIAALIKTASNTWVLFGDLA